MCLWFLQQGKIMKNRCIYIMMFICVLAVTGCGSSGEILDTGDRLCSMLLESPDADTLKDHLSLKYDIRLLRSNNLFLPVFNKNYGYIDIAVQEPSQLETGYETVIDAVLFSRYDDEYYEVSGRAVWTSEGGEWRISSVETDPVQ